MKTIFKYKIKLQREPQYLVTPGVPNIIRVGDQEGEPHVWCEITPEADPHSTRLYLVGTGWDIPQNTKYLGSADCSGFVWHIYKEHYEA